MGAVIAEETTNGIRSLRNKALQGWFNVILAVMGLGTLALFLFASRISSRIRALSSQTEQAIDEQGRIVHPIIPTSAGDEIGDLQRTFANMVDGLSQYTLYLQGMSARLSHELRTPVAVVKSSLESLEMDLPDTENNIYMKRAKEGVSRLSTILTLMSEATRLEQSLENTEITQYDISDVVSGCVQGYQLIQPQQRFTLTLATMKNTQVNGSPELFAQLLDKLLANAVEFSLAEQAVLISLTQQNQQAVLTIENFGTGLPEAMQERLFDSMVSVRSHENLKPNQQSQPHLGLGLYIARLIAEFHQGSISIDNNSDNTGVVAKVTLPLVDKKT